MNVHDSEEIAGILENLGCIRVEELEDADIAILNTCAIRENAHDKVFGFLGKCKHLKSKNKDMKIIICGCMAQEKSVVVCCWKTSFFYRRRKNGERAMGRCE